MKKSITKILRKAASESLEFPNEETIKRRYKKMKKSWKNNIKNGNKIA